MNDKYSLFNTDEGEHKDYDLQWIDIYGKRHHQCDMDIGYIKNCIAMLKRKSSRYYGTPSTKQWIRLFERELINRS